jgi:hypothetical protein
VSWNLPPYLRLKDAQMVAVCDVDERRLIRAQETVNERITGTSRLLSARGISARF